MSHRFFVPATAEKEFRSQGFLVVRNLIDAELLARFRSDMHQILRLQLSSKRLPLSTRSDFEAFYEDLKSLHSHDQDIYLAALRVFAKTKSLYDIFFLSPIIQAAESLGVQLPFLHTHPLLHLLSNQLRIRDGYHGFAAHQDWTGIQSSLNGIVVWLPLHETELETFPLEVLPKSHIQGLSPGHIENNEFFIDDDYLCGKEFIPVELGSGDAVFMSLFTVHRTRLTNSNGLRVAVSWRVEDACEKSFVDRHYPLAQSRLVQHDLFHPGHPDSELMKRILGLTIAETDTS